MSAIITVVRNGTRYEVWIGLRLLSTHSSIDAARTSARQITEAEWTCAATTEDNQT